MAKITLDIDDKNLATILTILENLKTGLIKDLSVNKIELTNKNVKPVSSSLDNQNTKRYLSKEKYKQKINQKPPEDEFFVKATSGGRYLSPADFKNKLKKGK